MTSLLLESPLDEHIPFEAYIADLQAQRETTCNRMLCEINKAFLAEFHRRMNNVAS